MCADSFDKVNMNVATFVSATSMDMLLHDVSSTAVNIDSSIIVNVGRAVLCYQNILDKACMSVTIGCYILHVYGKYYHCW